MAVNIIFLSCNGESTQGPANAAPKITSEGTQYAMEDQTFSFTPTHTDPDGPDTVVSFADYPSWLTEDADSLFGTPIEATPDTSFSVIVSDGIAADSLRVILIVQPVNDPPKIISTDKTEATGGIYFNYRISFNDPDGPDSIFRFENHPIWLTTDEDSLFGIPADGQSDTSFLVIVSDGFLADSQLVSIRMIPSIVVYGDSRTGHDKHQQIVSLIREVHPSTIFHSGDLVNNGNLQSDWDIFNSIVSEMISEAEFFPALGNHEYQSQLFFDNFELPNNEQWYSVERNNTHFIILNSCVPIGPASEQYQWLLADLAGINDSIGFIAAVFHHPPYSTGSHAEDEKGVRDTLSPLFEQYGIDLVFNGHDHDYEHSLCVGVHYIVTGGGGAPLRDQARQHPCSELYLKEYHFCKLSMIGDSLIVKVFNINSELIDQIKIVK
jgi:hypothetical protein